MLSHFNFKTPVCESGISEPNLRLRLSEHLFTALPILLLTAVTTFAQSTISVSVSPQRAGITVGQSLSYTATVTNDIGTAGVTWTASAGGTLNGQTTTTASFSAATAGVYTITATSIADVTKSASATIGVTDLAGVFTYHNDLLRDGSNPSEYALTTANVTAATFGKLFSCTVDGAIYAQPVWVANLTISGATHNVVFVATQHESLYAFDADASPCVTLWQASLIDTNHGGTAGETSVPSGPTGNLVGTGYGDITPEVGVTGTPVIDPATNTLYVVSKSVIPSVPTFFQRLHAIDLLTGNEKTNSPVTIAGTYPGTGDGGTATTFVARQQNQRPALALVNGTVYIAWSSHEDTAPYYGWVMGYNETNLAQAPVVLNLTPNVGYGGIWMGGSAPAADSSNNLYLITGNATFDATNSTAPNNDYGDSFLKLTSGLSVSQYFTPSDQASDNASDQDFGSGGAAILVDQPTSPVPHLVIGGGKDGYLYLLNRDSMGGLGDSNAWQRFYTGNGIFATGAFWNDRYYLAGINGHLQSYTFNAVTGMFGLSSVPQSPGTYGFPGSTPSVSSSGTLNGIVWALDNGKYCTNQSSGCGPAVLHAYDATNVATELWNSTQGTGNAAGNAVKFTVPTVANGKVYVGTRGNNTGGTTSSTTIPGELDVYGLLTTATTKPFSPIFVNSGGATYTDTLGNSWSADTDFTGGNTASTTSNIANTSDPKLYQTERYGNSTYQFTVPNGSYNVVLKFAEFYWTQIGQRIFNVSINGTQVLTNFDIIAAAGAPLTAIDKSFPVTVTGSSITIQFITGSADLPKISAIEVGSASGVFVQVSPTTASLYASQQQQFTASVTGSTNTAVNWAYSPQIGTLTAAGLYTAPTSVTTAQTVSVIATSQADTTKSAVATVNLLPPAGSFAPIFVNSGGGSYTDTLGNSWSADSGFTGGNTASTTSNIANTSDPKLYQTERYGNSTYQFTVPNGSYNVVLKFAEFYWTQIGQRIFNVSINGTQVLTNFDIIAAAGAPLTAIDKSFPVTVTGSSITIQFITGSADLPKISAIEVGSASGVFVQVSPTTASLYASQQQQFTASVTGSTNTAVNWAYSPQIGTLTAAGLYTAPTSVTTAQTVSVIATSQADTTKSAVATVNLLPPAGSFAPIFVNSGGGSYTDTLGNSWSADSGFTGGAVSSTTKAIANTSDPALYQNNRHGAFSYQFNVPSGNYTVILKFAETYWTSIGQRLFNISINGTQVLTNFDIVAAAGAPLTAIDKSFPVTVTGSSITIQFTNGTVDLPIIDAIEIKSASAVGIQITPSSAMLLASQSQQFGATVTGTTNLGVTWTFSPQVGTLVTSGATAGLYTAPSSITTAQTVSVTATSVADPTQSSSATVSLVPPFSPILVDSGGAAYTDTLAQVWSADTGFTGGSTASTTSNIANTSDPKLYQTERYGPFSYQFTVPNGSYNVVLKFAEIYWTQVGQRIFNVSINGTQVLTNFDIVAAAGAALTAIDKTFPVTVTNNQVTIQFTTGSADLPKVSAIEIH